MALTELLRYDWSSLRAEGSAAGIPDAIESLRTADSAEEATRAYWRIDNTVVIQGSLFEAAEATIPCVLAALNQCTDAARPRIFELLYQLGAGNTRHTEVNAGNRYLDDRCRAAVKLGVSQYFHFLEIGSAVESGYCADLIELCAIGDDALTARAIWWIGRMLELSTDVKLNDFYKLSDIYKACLRALAK